MGFKQRRATTRISAGIAPADVDGLLNSYLDPAQIALDIRYAHIADSLEATIAAALTALDGLAADMPREERWSLFRMLAERMILRGRPQGEHVGHINHFLEHHEVDATAAFGDAVHATNGNRAAQHRRRCHRKASELRARHDVEHFGRMTFDRPIRPRS